MQYNTIGATPEYELDTKIAAKASEHDLPLDIFLRKRKSLLKDDLLSNDTDFETLYYQVKFRHKNCHEDISFRKTKY